MSSHVHIAAPSDQGTSLSAVTKTVLAVHVAVGPRAREYSGMSAKRIAGTFHRPVVVQPGRLDRDRVVLSAADAAQVLFRRWPNDSAARRQALVACLQVMSGEKPPRFARSAFILAAKDARVFLGEQA